MQLLFIRHGQGEHNLPVPNRLNILHPRLTELGVAQIRERQRTLAISSNDLIFASPTVRTIEAAQILVTDATDTAILTTPLIGPRMYPQYEEGTDPMHPNWAPLQCDQTLTRQEIEQAYSSVRIVSREPADCWDEGINQMPTKDFHARARAFLASIRVMDFRRVLFLTHDGTITSYRELLGEEGLSRADFLGEAGLHEIPDF